MASSYSHFEVKDTSAERKRKNIDVFFLHCSFEKFDQEFNFKWGMWVCVSIYALAESKDRQDTYFTKVLGSSKHLGQ